MHVVVVVNTPCITTDITAATRVVVARDTVSDGALDAPHGAYFFRFSPHEQVSQP